MYKLFLFLNDVMANAAGLSMLAAMRAKFPTMTRDELLAIRDGAQRVQDEINNHLLSRDEN